jgi:hypothetical protein
MCRAAEILTSPTSVLPLSVQVLKDMMGPLEVAIARKIIMALSLTATEHYLVVQSVLWEHGHLEGTMPCVFLSLAMKQCRLHL